MINIKNIRSDFFRFNLLQTVYILSFVSQYTVNNFLYSISLVNWHNKRKHIVSFLQSTSSTRISLHSLCEFEETFQLMKSSLTSSKIIMMQNKRKITRDYEIFPDFSLILFLFSGNFIDNVSI